MTDYTNMSDEELLGQAAPEGTDYSATESEDETPVEAEQPEAATAEDAEIPEEEAQEETPADEGEEEPPAEEEPAAEEEAESEEAPAEEPEQVEESTEDAGPDYEALYKAVMAPVKANKGEFTPENPEEVRRLMQQGANYVKKMTAIKPRIRQLQALQNAGITDDEALNRLIDLHNGNKAAIADLLRRHKVDPLDIDTSSQTAYTPNQHQISEAEAVFRETLDDVRSNYEYGNEVVNMIHQTWDTASRDQVFANPEIMKVLATQKANGVYDKIQREMERQQVLGKIPAETPFITAYYNVGTKMDQEGKLAAEPAVGHTTPQQTTPLQQPIQKRVVRSPASPTNGDRVRAAGAVRTSPKSGRGSAVADFDPVNMTDDELMAATPPKKY